MAPMSDPRVVLETLARIDERLIYVIKTVDELKVTVEELKQFRWKLMGACLMVGGGAGILAKSLL